MSALEELTRLASEPVNPAIQEWKSQGKKVVGFFCTYVPEEILYAAGIFPYRVRAAGCTNTNSADVYMSQVNCSFVRSCLEYAFEGKYDFLDGMVFTRSCDNIRRLYDLFRVIMPDAFPFLHFIDMPHKVNEEAIILYREFLEEFKNHIEEFFGVEITDARLLEAINTYNETRTLLKQLYELRKADNPPISGAETLSVTLASTTLPRDRYNRLLKQLLEELGQRKGISDYKARLSIAGGGGCDNPAFYEIIEELGGLIVSDSICYGSRYFWEPVETNGDLLRSLARSYLNSPSCPRMVEKLTERCDFARQTAEDSKADGVIFQRLRYCDLWGGEQLNFRKKMKDEGVPLLSLEREYWLSATGQLRTRVQAFLESLEA
ncbi:MAG: 2-hydroxyacyl-CoA dehydratase family protein [Dehalococcoidia bacterium]